MRDYKGITVEESLEDNRVLDELDVIKVHITGQVNSSERPLFIQSKYQKRKFRNSVTI